MNAATLAAIAAELEAVVRSDPAVAEVYRARSVVVQSIAAGARAIGGQKPELSLVRLTWASDVLRAEISLGLRSGNSVSETVLRVHAACVAALTDRGFQDPEIILTVAHIETT